ncbi:MULTISPECIES: chorismate--pyruvate lyase family protein [Streptomyces]|uniref:4-hydroxybenzoate synthetase (Chorismate-pyruvate lyase) n=1 Tax=Streptomyces harbinensis TaxID=1176198 RepID=A0A1I6RIS6_9ACTN|nr:MULTISPECIES: hypothetical protein [Streptomyces]QKV68666.1 hypothetical protein HUT13_07620 [Streptomyces harbinensis]SFS64544.1 4-hydroxybenzoate synthetase (chorismate-pyruvate lyase) [Streptomyces harbinensis]
MDIDGEVFDADGTGGTVAERIAGFSSPLTRMLLSSEGLTTTALWALTGAPPRIRVLGQGLLPAARAGRAVPALLAVGPGRQVLARRSALTGPDGRWLSVNQVVARDDQDPGIRSALTDGHRPLGPALQDAGTGHRRTLLDAGRRPWPSGRTACYKTYLLWHGDAPLALVHELFHPAVVAP